MDIKTLGAFQEYREDSFTKRIVYKRDESTVFLLNFMPGQEIPKHEHPGSQVYILVLQGTGTVYTDDGETGIKQDDIINFGGEESFAIKNTGDGQLSLYVFLNKIPDGRYVEEV